MSKKIFILIIFLFVFGFFNIKKIKEAKAQTLPEKVFVAAMRTQYTGAGNPFVDGYFYVPNISAPRNPKWVRVMSLFQLDNNGLSFEGDQTGGSNDYFTNVPDGKVDGKDGAIFSPIPLPTNEGDPKWDYMADINADTKITIDDKNIVSGNFGHGGNNITNLTNVTIQFRDSTNSLINGPLPIDAQGFVEIPNGAANFTVMKDGTPIGAYVYFYAQRPNLMGWAWSENIGWISLNSVNCNTDGDGKYEGASEDIQPVPANCPTSGPAYNYGVYLPRFDAEGDPVGDPNYSDYFKGYAWSDKIGWIKFNPVSPPGGTNCMYQSAARLGASEVFGFIRACAGAENADCTGGTNPNAGGWDGWICMSGVTLAGQPYEVTYESFTKEFKGWAWGGGGTSNQNAVVGWISFNCKDRKICSTTNQICDFNTDCPGGETCVAQQADGDTACTISDYKVTYQPSNFEPTASNAKITGTDYCTKSGDLNGVQKGQVSFSWDYTDFEGDYHERYWLQIATDPTFTNKVIDCQVPTHPLIKVDPNVPHLMTSGVDVVSSNSDEYNNRCNDGGELGTRKLAISYDDGSYHYYWQVASKECQDPPACTTGNWSTDWAVWDVDGSPGPDSFTTHTHASPWPDFSWDPLYPAVYQPVTFTDTISPHTTTFYDGTSPTDCQTDPNSTNCHYKWEFVDPPSTIEGDGGDYRTATHAFESAGTKSVKFTARDSDSFQCPVSLPVQVGLPLPQWKEIPPF
jgi:hypothetical protein